MSFSQNLKEAQGDECAWCFTLREMLLQSCLFRRSVEMAFSKTFLVCLYLNQTIISASSLFTTPFQETRWNDVIKVGELKVFKKGLWKASHLRGVGKFLEAFIFFKCP